MNQCCGQLGSLEHAGRKAVDHPVTRLAEAGKVEDIVRAFEGAPPGQTSNFAGERDGFDCREPGNKGFLLWKISDSGS